MGKCKYCDIEKMEERVEDLYWNNLDNQSNYTILGIYYDIKKEDWFLEASGDDDARKNINFCPFCGRQLNKKYKATR